MAAISAADETVRGVRAHSSRNRESSPSPPSRTTNRRSLSAAISAAVRW